MGLLDLIFPKKCLGCGQFGEYVCANCEIGLWEADQACSECNLPATGGVTHTSCQREQSLDGLTCLWANEGLARKLITRATKYHHFDYLRDLVVKSKPLFASDEFAPLLNWIKRYHPVLFSPMGENSQAATSIETVGQELSRILKTQRSRGSVKGRQAVLLVNLEWHRSILDQVASLRKSGVKKVWGLVLAK